METAEYKIIEEGEYKYYYLTNERRIRFDLSKETFSRCTLQELRTYIDKSFFSSSVKTKWVDLSYVYESQFIDNMSGLIYYLEWASKRAWGGSN